MESRVLIVLLKRATALALWKNRILGTAIVPNLAFKLKKKIMRKAGKNITEQHKNFSPGCWPCVLDRPQLEPIQYRMSGEISLIAY